MIFKELVFSDISETHGEGAIQAYVELPNGFEVSIVKHKFSHGHDKGLYEIGVFKGCGMCDPFDWGEAVKGWLTPEDVEKQLALISAKE